MSACGVKKIAYKVLNAFAFAIVCLGFFIFVIFSGANKSALETFHVSYIFGIIGIICHVISNMIYIHPHEMCEN